MKPFQIVYFLAFVFLGLGVLSVIFPKNGIQIGKLTLEFPTVSEVFNQKEDKYDKVNLLLTQLKDSILVLQNAALQDSIALFASKKVAQLERISYPKNDKSILYPFFRILDDIKTENQTVRIIHYGDSQIEEDRISSYIREQLQNEFGGGGPGMLSAVQVTGSITVRSSRTENWTRYTVFGFDTLNRLNSRRFGVMGIVCKFEPPTAHVAFKTTNSALDKAKKFNQIKIFYGGVKSDASVDVYSGGQRVGSSLFRVGNKAYTLTIPLPTSTSEVNFQFNALEEFEVYGIALDQNQGIAVDNIPMRGCSGTIFTKIDTATLAPVLRDANVKLIILQFGGNMMPSIKNEKDAEWYGEVFQKQINFIKSIAPNIAILMIGPSDMSRKIRNEMVTWPYLPEVRDALKKACMESGAMYWDMFEAMGGENSMPVWVNSSPALAAPDYIHFTRLGAEKISKMFYAAFIQDYNEYRYITEKQQLRRRLMEEVNRVVNAKDTLTQ